MVEMDFCDFGRSLALPTAGCRLVLTIMASRLNYQNGVDICKEETWQLLQDLRRQRRPHRLWFSVPCTKRRRLTSVKYNTPEKKETEGTSEAAPSFSLHSGEH